MIGVCSQCIASLAKCPTRTNNWYGFTTSNVLTLSNRRTSSWNGGNINYLITNLIMLGLLGYKVICAKEIKTFWMWNILSEKCYCFYKISFGCLLGSCFYECVQTVSKLLRTSFYDFVIFHSSASIHFKRNCVPFLCQPTNQPTNQQTKRRFGRFSLESLRHPIEAGFIFSLIFPLICPLFIVLSLLDNVVKAIFSKANKDYLFTVTT